MLILTIAAVLLVVFALAMVVSLRARLTEAKSKVTTMTGEKDVLATKLEAAERESDQAVKATEARLGAVLETERAAHAQHVEQLQEATQAQVKLIAGNREDFVKEMKGISASVTTQATEQFRQMAEESRKQDRQVTSRELEAKANEIKAAISPVTEKLGSVEKQVETLDRERRRTEGEVNKMFESMTSVARELRLEVGQLSSALKRPNVRGSWGEMQLKNVVKVANMTEHVRLPLPADARRRTGRHAAP